MYDSTEHIFLSDVHLGAFSDERNQKIESDLISLVNYCLENRIQLHILGDLFDYWMEYPSHIPQLGKNLLETLANYNKNFKAANYILGNHDNWTLGFFDKLGFNTEKNFLELNLDGKWIFMHHGDGLSDPKYNLQRPLFHRIIRSAWFTKLYQLIFPPEAGLNLMKKFSTISKESPEMQPERLSNWSKAFLSRSKFDVVISGHDHNPRTETFPSGTYINVGTFFDHRTVVYYTNNKLVHVIWNADEKKLISSGNIFEN